MKILVKYLVTTFLIISISLSPLIIKPVHAQWVVFDPITEVSTTAEGPIKEFGLDTIAWLIVNMVIERIAASTVNWINSGFQGSPAFVTDPDSYFKNIGNQVAGQVIYNHPDLKFMCADFSAKVRIALTKNYIRPFGDYQCTLSGVVDNFDNFMNDFYQGGWDGFIEVSQRSQSNPLGLYNQQKNQLNVTLGSSLGQKREELNWGSGFLSYKSCEQYDEGAAGQTVAAGQILVGIDAEGNEIYAEHPEQKLPDIPPKCIKTKTNTPGSVISEQLNKTLGIGNERLQVGDEINEIISALLNQLVSKALGAVGKGLRSLSSPGSGDHGGSFATELQGATAWKDRIPMPTGGVCPARYEKISDTECGTNEDVNKIEDDVKKIESDLAASIAETEARLKENEAQQNNNFLTLPDGRTINCNLFSSLSPEDQAACAAAGKGPPSDTSGFAQ